jgi:hypothetical protein
MWLPLHVDFDRGSVNSLGAALFQHADRLAKFPRSRHHNSPSIQVCRHVRSLQCYAAGMATMTFARRLEHAFQKAPRCCAISKRTRVRCKAPAVRGWKVCRFHGAPKGKRNGMYRHGLYTKEAVKDRRFLRQLLQQSRAAVTEIGASLSSRSAMLCRGAERLPLPGLLDFPLEPVIGPAYGRARWRE